MMVSLFIALLASSSLAAGINSLLQLILLQKKIAKVSKEIHVVKSLTTLLAFKKFIDIVSADESQTLIEELLVGLRTLPSFDSVSNFVESKLSKLKGSVIGFLDSLNTLDVVTSLFTKVQVFHKHSISLNVISLTFLFLSFLIPLQSFLFLGLSLGFEVDSLSFLFYTVYYLEKLERLKQELKSLTS
jgi:hypothetical protein